jgi:hypothetical protein
VKVLNFAGKGEVVENSREKLEELFGEICCLG